MCNLCDWLAVIDVAQERSGPYGMPESMGTSCGSLSSLRVSLHRVILVRFSGER